MNTAKQGQSAGIAGLCFLACVLIPILAQVSTLFRHYAPIAREWLLWLMVPQFGMGMVFAFGLTTACLFLLAWRRP